jgi:hypothetical protein
VQQGRRVMGDCVAWEHYEKVKAECVQLRAERAVLAMADMAANIEIAELRAERDAALAWAALWKRVAIVNRFDREHREWFVWRRALLSGLRTFPKVRYSPMIRRALGL